MNLQQDFELRTAEIESGEAIDHAIQSRGMETVPGSGTQHDPAVGAIHVPLRDHRTSTARSRVPIAQEELAALCKANGIRKLAIFGSALREDFNSESDIDFLAEFEPGQVPSLIGLAGIQIELTDLLGGREADLRTAEELSEYFCDNVLREAETLYERGG